MISLSNVYFLGIKELWSLIRNPMLLILGLYLFSADIYIVANATPDSINKAAIAIVDEDQSQLSSAIIAGLQKPYFLSPQIVSLHQMDEGLDQGNFTFALDIPLNFERDVLSGSSPAIQLNVDATQMSQAFTGSGYIQQIVSSQVYEYVARQRAMPEMPVKLELRAIFNPNLTSIWFASIMELINNVTMISIILTGAALIREREQGTLDHLMSMPITPTEIMLSKIWSMGLVVFVASLLALVLMVHSVMNVPIAGSVTLFMVGVSFMLFATTSMGIFMATVASSMPQFGILLVLVLIPLQMLSGSSTPTESMPQILQNIMQFAPTTHFC